MIFIVTIKETLLKPIHVIADSKEDAIENARSLYNASKIHLNYDNNFDDVEYTANRIESNIPTRKLKQISTELCGSCNMEYETETSPGTCTHCGHVESACNACINHNHCNGCNHGEHFIEES